MNLECSLMVLLSIILLHVSSICSSEVRSPINGDTRQLFMRSESGESGVLSNFLEYHPEQDEGFENYSRESRHDPSNNLIIPINTGLVPVNRVMPVKSINSALNICYTAFIYKLIWPPSHGISIAIISLIAATVILSQIPFYIGFYMIGCPPRFQEITYNPAEGTVPFSRWILVTTALITELVSFFSEPYVSPPIQISLCLLFALQILYVIFMPRNIPGTVTNI